MGGFAWTLFWPGDTKALRPQSLKRKRNRIEMFSHKSRNFIPEKEFSFQQILNKCLVNKNVLGCYDIQQ